MSQNAEAVLEQINALSAEEWEAVYQALQRRRDRVARVKAALDEARGKLAGAWGEGDVQDWVRQERDNDRF